jgi:hypothetical protein
VGLAITTFAASAAAYGGGASGYTGKQEGRTCNSCHSGGTAPQVTITGPDSLAAGATGDFTMVVSTNQTKAAGGIAASDSATLAPTKNLIEEEGELTHSNGGVTVSGGKASFSFKLTAPANGTTMRIFAVGLAANGSGTGGDAATQITKDVTITGGGTATTPPPSSSEQPDKAAPGSTSTSTSTSTDATEPTSSKKSTKKTGDDDDDDDDGNTRTRRDPFAGDATTACAMRPGKLDPFGLGALAGVVFGLALIARRRRV